MASFKYSSSAPSLTLPSPRSPPKYPDLSGKRRELAKIQILEREIGFLEEELKSCEGLQLASRSCKEVDDFVGANPDPLIPRKQKARRSHRFWKLIRGNFCFNLSWVWCFGGCCSIHLGTINCCSLKNWRCFHWPRCFSCACQCCCCCFDKTSCRKCCILQVPTCPDCPCPKCTWSCPECTCSCPKCTKVCPCSSNCTKACCNPCCLFY